MAAVGLRARLRPHFIPNAEPNVIPFIDVLLVLLIIFMVTAPKPTTDLRVDLPRPNPGSPMITIPPTVVQLRPSAGGGVAYFVSGEEVRRDQLAQEALARMLAADRSLTPEAALREGRIFVRADLDVAYQDVVSAVDTLQHAQFAKVAIVAQNADAPP